MTISSAPTVPSNIATFETDADAFLRWLAQASNTASCAFRNYGLLAAGSDSSLSLTPGEKTIVLGSDSAFAKGHYVRVFDIADEYNNWMSGFVTDYVSGTKTLTVEIDQVSGSGAKSAWVVELSSYLVTQYSVQSVVSVNQGNGHGSTNTKIRRFGNTVKAEGTAITYADSATDGATFTINEDGIYIMVYGDDYSVASNNYGISLNSAQLTTSIQSINTANILSRKSSTASIKGIPAKSMRPLLAGNVIRAHTDGLCNSTTGDTSYFIVRKVR